MAAKKTTAAPKEDPKPTPAPTEAPEPMPIEDKPVERDAAADLAPEEAAAPNALELAPTEAPAAAPIPDLDDFIAAHEKAAQAVDLVVTAISHPDAKPGHRIGVYSGFPITNGPLQATYNDGSTH
jgi:hypothetical protein